MLGFQLWRIFHIREALVLGLASGPACLASCGPVVVPSYQGPGIYKPLRIMPLAELATISNSFCRLL